MFEQLPAWHSKISLRVAILNAIACGFAAGIALGAFVVKVALLRIPVLYQVADLFYLVAALAAAVRFYFLAMSRARENTRPAIQ
ncbi:MAG TPA: hypothetical protein VMI10_05035 [Terriglobales bacterium]|nr:hypothetical protein [Terriglobales bacterium]